ncbi:hypothetical protein, variant [Aphanomyces astaci]|uniref:Cyclic nucleotide-binding domain-containing protein n=1 Tax=Aphanomyces astaci TaxID=112090 RepID=W4H8B0_APHAT|nr:hypothetical protein, variant [Aphanomyces astaci]ETV87519.1 hypothetical protein, variant [Aphanomyces astaci]|eukprot:XP_009822382.1 hypothetical protein, variant [Aphanomyces astaci]
MPPPTPAEKAELEKLLDKMNLDTGDVVLFDRKCNSMGVYGGVICHSAKLFGQTRWDHNGVIYKTDDGKLMFLEAAMNGVKLRPLVDRILHSRSYEVRIQKVEVHRTPEFRQRAADFIRRVVEQDIPYEDRIQVLVNAGASFVPSRVAREQFYHDIVDLKRHMKTIQDDLTHRSKMSPFEQNSLRAELASLREQHDALVHQLDQTERSIFENKPSSASDPARFFCSQLVAALYQHVGLLLPYPAATSYRPHNFSDTDDYVKLQNAAWLPQISLREHIHETKKHLIEQAATAASPPPPDVVDTIVHTLQRHAIFHSFSVSELQALAQQFRPKRFVPGQVVFYQGDPGDFFYVIADGTVDVLVNYDAYAHEQPKHSVAAEVTAAPVLRRNLSTSFDNPQPTSHFVHVATNGRGNAFGDSALMYQTPRRATVKCAEPVVAYALDKATFASVVKSHPAATQSLSERQFLIQTLANHPLFAHVSKQAQAAAVRQCFSLHFPKDALVLEQGQFGDYFYVVETGACAVSRHHTDGDEFLDRVVGRGDAFGEVALLYNSRRGASVRAVEDSKIWCMDRSILLSTTRSGSTALLDIFNKTATLHDGDESFLTPTDVAKLLEGDSGVETAQTLLFPSSATTKINFSQFAHFHMCLEAYSSRQFNPLLAEALYRALLRRAGTHHDNHLTTASLHLDAAETRQIHRFFQKSSATDTITYHDCVVASRAWRHDPSAAPPAIAALLRTLHADLTLLEQQWKHTAFDMASYSGSTLPPPFSSTSSTTPLTDAPVPFRSLFSLQDVFAAILAGVLARSATAPLERVKLARQVGLLPSHLNLWRSVQHLKRVAGWQRLFAGNLVHCAKLVPSFPLKLVACDVFRQHFHAWGFNAEVKNALAGGSAGVMVQAVLYPLDVVRGRLALQQILQPKATYPTVASCVQAMLHQDGVRSFYRGFGVGTLGVFPYIGLNFAMYEFLRPWLVVQQQHRVSDCEDHHQGSVMVGQIACALGASVTAQVATYPLDLVRRKMQMHGNWLAPHVFPTYTSTWNCIKQTASGGGAISFYRGLAPNIVKALPASVVSFLVYETCRQDTD